MLHLEKCARPTCDRALLLLLRCWYSAAILLLHFRCGRRRVSDYSNLQGWMHDVWQIKVPGSSMQVRLLPCCCVYCRVAQECTWCVRWQIRMPGSSMQVCCSCLVGVRTVLVACAECIWVHDVWQIRMPGSSMQGRLVPCCRAYCFGGMCRVHLGA
jgi:hypothetical protein